MTKTITQADGSIWTDDPNLKIPGYTRDGRYLRPDLQPCKHRRTDKYYNPSCGCFKVKWFCRLKDRETIPTVCGECFDAE